jgi:hypothetical protein
VLNLGNEPFNELLHLTLTERLKWRLGWRPDAADMAKRIVHRIDLNGTGHFPPPVMDIVLKNLQDRFTVGRETFDFVEVRAHVCVL